MNGLNVKEMNFIQELVDEELCSYGFVFQYGQLIHVNSVSLMCRGQLYKEYTARIIDRICLSPEYDILKNGTSLLPGKFAYLIQKQNKNNKWSKPYPINLDWGQGCGTKIKQK